MSLQERNEEELVNKPIDKTLFKRLIVYFKPYKKHIWLATILAITIAGLAAARPFFTHYAVDTYIANGDKRGLLLLILLLFGSLILQGIIQYIMAYLTSWIGQKITYDLRKKVFAHITALNLKFFDSNPIGRLVTRATSDIEVLFEVFSSGLVTAFGDIFLLALIVAGMFIMDVKLALITLSVLPVLIYATIIFRKNVRNSFRKIRILIARINAYIQEHLSGVTIVQYFNKESDTIDRFDEINTAHTKENIKNIFYYAVFFPIVEFIGVVSVGLIIWYGGGEVLRSAMSVGIILAFVQYTEMFFRPIRDLSEKYNILQLAMASSERLFKLLDEKSPILDPEVPVKRESIKGEIEFRNVWFAYNDEDYVLKDISFKINPGEKIAFVGATGAGKSTIINLLTRFYDVNKGSICLDGIDIRTFSQHDLRKNIAVVLQDVFLFAGTIKYNINLGSPEVTDERVLKAIKNTGLEPYINSLNERELHKVFERGSTLSAGQRQLISFARALAYDPRILILDEATSSVDTHTEILIQEAIKKLIEGRTSIIIAHRLSTIQNCDKIIVMHKGEIKESGTHQQLLEKGGLYYKLYQLQYKEELSDV